MEITKQVYGGQIYYRIKGLIQFIDVHSRAKPRVKGL